MKLIIAEKPSLGRTIADAVGAHGKGNGYIEGNGYIVSWCFGHLYELYDPEQYVDPAFKKGDKVSWKKSMAYLPLFPDGWDFKYTGKPDCKEQIALLKSLMNRDDVDTIYAAGDADREGEVIVRLAVDASLEGDKPVLRVWTSSLTAGAIREAINSARPETEYTDLYTAGKTRAYVDWLIGINLTRFVSVKTGSFLRIGRCVCPIVQKIVEREQQINDFVPEKYYVAEGVIQKGEGRLTLTSKKRFTQDEGAAAQEYCDLLNSRPTIVEQVTKKKQTVKPPRLFSLSDLQSYASKQDRRLKPSDVLASAQRLYEKGYISYPRTNSSFLCADERGKVDDVLDAFRASGVTDIANRRDKQVYDDSKVESHSAIIPTVKLPSGLSGTDGKVYSMIRGRFLAVFCSRPCIVEKTTAKIVCGPEKFDARGDVQIAKGWRMFEEPLKKDTPLIPLEQGEVLEVEYKPVQKETQPPKHFTVESLNKWMNAPFKDDAETKEDYTDEEWKDILSEATICTEATRAQIIDNCIRSEYIELKKGTYYALEKGFYLVKVMKELELDLGPAKTAALSRDLHDISVGRKDDRAVLEDTKTVVSNVFEKTNVTAAPAGVASSASGTVIGKCPKCGKNVIVTPKVYCCEDRGCGFAIWKNNRYFQAIGYKLTDARVKTLLANGRVLAKGLKSKKGNTYDAYIILKDVSGKYPAFTMEFPGRTGKRSS